MTRPAVPNSHPREQEHRRSIAHLLNLVSQTTPDHSETQAEKDAGVTPVDRRYPEGHVLRYGLKGDLSTDVTTLAQSIIDIGTPFVYFPEGTYHVTLLELGEGQTLYGDGVGRTVFKLPDDAAGYRSSVGNQGLTGKTGISLCTFRDFEYDGNAANNRDWGNGSASWTPTEYDLNFTHGIWFSTIDSRTPPTVAILKNLYIHDTVRDGLVWAETYIQGENLRFKNSDADHLIYDSGTTGGSGDFVNVLLEGHARNGLLIANGSNFQNLTIRNIAANPTVYDTDFVLSQRESDALSNFSNVRIEGFDPSVFAANDDIFFLLGSCNINGFTVEQSSTDTTAIDAFQCHGGLGVAKRCNINGFTWNGARDGAQLLRVQNTQTAVEDLKFKDININYAGSISTSSSLVNFGNVDGLLIDGLTVRGAGAGRLFTVASSQTLSNVRFKNVYMETMHTTGAAHSGSGVVAIKDSIFDGTGAALSNTLFSGGLATLDNVTIDGSASEARGTSTQSGDGLDTTFVIAHGLCNTPQEFSVVPETDDAMAEYALTADATNITVTFTVAPASGTDNLRWRWSASVTRP